MYNLQHYVLDVDQIKTLEDVKLILGILELTSENVPPVEALHLFRLEDKRMLSVA